MDNRSRRHSGPGTEHQFAEDDARLVKDGIKKLIQGEGLENGAEILAGTVLELQRNTGELDAERKRQEKRKAAYIVILGSCGMFILFTCLIEKLCSVIDRNAVLLVQVILALIQILPGFFGLFRVPGKSRTRKAGEGILEAIWKCIKSFFRRFSRASGLHVRLLLTAVLLLSCLAAQVTPLAHLKVFWSGGRSAVISYNSNNNVNNNVNDNVNNNINETGIPTGDSPAKVLVTYEMKQYLTASDPVMIGLLDKAEVVNEQRNLALKLSKEDEYNIFLRWGNGTEGYLTQEELNGNVLSAVQVYCGERRDNVFDRDAGQGGAPQDVRNIISRLSDSESQGDSFAKTAERLDVRESVVRQYPKRTLMQLVANDYQGLALRLVWHEGIQSTVIYYYGQSILFDFECLKFADNTDTSIKLRLTVIAQRYEDIAYVCPDYERAGEARRLAAAFRNAADQY